MASVGYDSGMKNLNRREMCLALSAVAAFGGIELPAEAEGAAGETLLATSKVIAFDQLAVTRRANGGAGRAVMEGTLPTGESLEIHETVLPPGQMPHPPHRHPNTEIMFIQEGKLEYTIDGRPMMVGPGGIVFSASNVMHGLKNVGDSPASYIVVSVGRKLKA